MEKRWAKKMTLAFLVYLLMIPGVVSGKSTVEHC